MLAQSARVVHEEYWVPKPVGESHSGTPLVCGTQWLLVPQICAGASGLQGPPLLLDADELEVELDELDEVELAELDEVELVDEDEVEEDELELLVDVELLVEVELDELDEVEEDELELLGVHTPPEQISPD